MKEQRTVHGMLIVSLLGIVLAPFCAKPPSHYTWMDFFIGKVDIIDSNGAVERAEIKKELFVDDTVRTGDKSYAFIQHGVGILVQVFGTPS